MSFPLPVCTSCGHAVFPPRVMCPSCGGRRWRTEHVDHGVLEEVTERDSVRIGSVRTDLGPVVVARLGEHANPGDRIRLDADGGVPVGASN